MSYRQCSSHAGADAQRALFGDPSSVGGVGIVHLGHEKEAVKRTGIVSCGDRLMRRRRQVWCTLLRSADVTHVE